MSILEEQLNEKRAYATASLKEARRFNRFITVTSVGVESLELAGYTVECLKVYFDGVYGYIPKDKMDDYEFRSLNAFVDGEFQVFVEQVITDEHNTFFIGNRKEALTFQADLFWAGAAKRKVEGQIFEAFVSGVDRANVYLIINGVRHRMAKEDYSYSYHRDLRDEVATGSTIEVKITSIDAETKKLTASRRVLEADPRTFLSEYKEGGTYAAEVNNIDFERNGIFVTLKPRGITALANLPALRVGKHIEVGDTVNFKVTNVDLGKGTIFGRVIVQKVAQMGKARRS